MNLKNLGKEALTLAILTLGVFSFRSSVADHYVVPTGSMRPSILPGDHLLVLKNAYQLRVPFTELSLSTFQEPKRGDVIVFKYPVDPTTNYVKRLIGLPGDQIEVENGRIQINKVSVPISEGEVQELTRLTEGDIPNEVLIENIEGRSHWIQRVHKELNPINHKKLHFHVPKDHYFFMGDNRDESNDSRFWGFVPRSHLLGKALRVGYSLDTEDKWIPSIRWARFGQKL